MRIVQRHGDGVWIMGKTKKVLTSTPVLALGAWMGYNLFIKRYFPPETPVLGDLSAYKMITMSPEWPTMPLLTKIQLLGRIGLTGSLDLQVTQG